MVVPAPAHQVQPEFAEFTEGTEMQGGSRGASEHASIPPAPPSQSKELQGPRGFVVQYPEKGTLLQSPRGSYTVLNVLGSGAFGAVYECVGPFDQGYALKMVRPANRAYAEVQAEWAREVQRLMSLRHPNVVYIYDAFADGNLFYLALERCDHALTEMLGAPMQEGLVIELARQLLAAVQFLHDNDVVHDDLHAGNVLITHTDRPQVKISDFGISHELRGMPAIRPDVVHHAIMAPEILATGYTSKQSDIYQIGLLLYWMLTGHSAIKLGVPYSELASQVSAGEPRRKAEAIGTPIGALIAKMLRRRETFRYAAAREVWADMRQLESWRSRILFPLK
jgi:eukaryotic-like serine/threonine-protein kinase